MGKNTNVLKLGGKNLDADNWKVFHPNGKHMFTCGGKKARWYLKNNLAHVTAERSIMFDFVPKGEGYSDNEDFGRAVRINRCVVNGEGENLQRHHIVPYCYRQYFPMQYKSKNHHDVVLIGSKNHSDYEIEASKFKNELAYEFNIKTIEQYNRIYTGLVRSENRGNVVVLSRLNAILKGHGNIPMKLIEENLLYVSNEIGLDYDFLIGLNYIQIFKLYSVLSSEYSHKIQQFHSRHRKYYDHGYHMIKKLDTDEKIAAFVKRWRKHFIDTMNPQYMPEGWSLDFRHKTSM